MEIVSNIWRHADICFYINIYIYILYMCICMCALLVSWNTTESIRKVSNTNWIICMRVSAVFVRTLMDSDAQIYLTNWLRCFIVSSNSTWKKITYFTLLDRNYFLYFFFNIRWTKLNKFGNYIIFDWFFQNNKKKINK